MNDEPRLRQDLKALLDKWEKQRDFHEQRMENPERGDDTDVDETIMEVIGNCKGDLWTVLSKPPQQQVDPSTDAYAEDFVDALWDTQDDIFDSWLRLHQPPDPIRLMVALIRRFFQTHRMGYTGAIFDIMRLFEGLCGYDPDARRI